MGCLNLVQLCSIKGKVNLIKCKSKQKNYNTKISSSEQHGEQWGMAPCTIPRFLVLVYLSQSLLGEVLVKLLTPLFDRVLSRTLHTHRVSRLPFHGVLQRPRACFFLVSGIHCMYNDAVSSPFDDDILLKKKFNTSYYPPQGPEPLYFL